MSYELFDKPVDGPGGISHLSPLSFVHVSKQFGNFWANRDITLELPFGQIVGILGPNGAGKSQTSPVSVCVKILASVQSSR